MKIYNYVLLSVLLMTILGMLGFGFTSSSWVMQTLGLNSLTTIQSSHFWVVLFSVLFSVSFAGAIVGTFFSISPLPFIKGTVYMGLLGGLILDYVSILTQPNIAPWVQGILSIVFLPLIGGFLIALEQAWEGTD